MRSTRLIVVTDLAIADVSGWEVRLLEPGGGDANIWLIDPEIKEYALFKPVVAKAGRRQGEDWAEKAVEQIAELLGVPSATRSGLTSPTGSGSVSWPRIRTWSSGRVRGSRIASRDARKSLWSNSRSVL